MNKNGVINSLKGIAVLGVILVHYGSEFSNSFINAVISNGARGVQLFLVINGYLIFSSLDKINFSKIEILYWWKNKFLRIIPLYWFFTILHIIIFGLGPRYYLGPLNHVSALNIICNLLFLHNFYPYYNAINANWFMGVVAIFYVIAPFLKKVLDSFEKAICMLFVILPLGYVLMHICIVGYHGEYQQIWLDYVQILSFIAEFPVILVGIIIFYAEKENKLNCINSKMVSVSLLVVCTFGALCMICNKHILVFGNNILTFGLISGLLLVSQMICPFKMICN